MKKPESKNENYLTLKKIGIPRFFGPLKPNPPLDSRKSQQERRSRLPLRVQQASRRRGAKPLPLGRAKPAPKVSAPRLPRRKVSGSKGDTEKENV